MTLNSLQHVPLIRHGDNLADILVPALAGNKLSLEDHDILVVAQKIVSKSEGRGIAHGDNILTFCYNRAIPNHLVVCTQGYHNPILKSCCHRSSFRFGSLG